MPIEGQSALEAGEKGGEEASNANEEYGKGLKESELDCEKASNRSTREDESEGLFCDEYENDVDDEEMGNIFHLVVQHEKL